MLSFTTTNEMHTDNEELSLITQVPKDRHFLLYLSILVDYSRFCGKLILGSAQFKGKNLMVTLILI